MRKGFLSILMVLALVAFVGCSSDSSDSNKSAATINPPSWILGTWYYTDSDGFSDGYKFENHDLSELSKASSSGGSWDESSVSYAGIIKTYEDKWPATVTEEKTDTYYKITIKYADKNFQYHFVKKSNNQIQEILADPNGVALYTKQ